MPGILGPAVSQRTAQAAKIHSAKAAALLPWAMAAMHMHPPPAGRCAPAVNWGACSLTLLCHAAYTRPLLPPLLQCMVAACLQPLLQKVSTAAAHAAATVITSCAVLDSHVRAGGWVPALKHPKQVRDAQSMAQLPQQAAGQSTVCDRAVLIASAAKLLLWLTAAGRCAPCCPAAANWAPSPPGCAAHLNVLGVDRGLLRHKVHAALALLLLYSAAAAAGWCKSDTMMMHVHRWAAAAGTVGAPPPEWRGPFSCCLHGRHRPWTVCGGAAVHGPLPHCMPVSACIPQHQVVGVPCCSGLRLPGCCVRLIGCAHCWHIRCTNAAASQMKWHVADERTAAPSNCSCCCYCWTQCLWPAMSPTSRFAFYRCAAASSGSAVPPVAALPSHCCCCK